MTSMIRYCVTFSRPDSAAGVVLSSSFADTGVSPSMASSVSQHTFDSTQKGGCAMYAAARSLLPCHDGPTIVRCTSANAAALVVVALVDDAHLQPGHAFSVAPVPAFDAPFTFTITAPLPVTVAHQIGTLPDTTLT
jgi:hypothetical protein